LPETRQPYHHGTYTTEEDAREIARRVKIVTRCANASVAALIQTLERDILEREALAERSIGGSLRSALVVRSPVDPGPVRPPSLEAGDGASSARHHHCCIPRYRQPKLQLRDRKCLERKEFSNPIVSTMSTTAGPIDNCCFHRPARTTTSSSCSKTAVAATTS